MISLLLLLLDSPLTYKEKVINRFKFEIKGRTGTDKHIRTNYRYIYENKVYEFDIVELDDQDNISKIYEIKKPSAVKNIPNTVQNLLQTYKKITKADAFLIYLDEETNKIVQYNLSEEKQGNSQVVCLIDSFSKFYKELTEKCRDFDDLIFFRGHSDYKYALKPGVYRDGYIKSEDAMYREAIRKNPAEFTEDMTTFDKLVKMQHLGLPTRLLDITSNPLVALYFACQGKGRKNKKKDGEVLLFRILRNQVEYFDSTAVCILSNLAKQTNFFSYKKGKQNLIESIQEDIPMFPKKKLELDALKRILCVMPKLNNERILRQDGAFFLFGIYGYTKSKPKKFEDTPITFRIKADCKDAILEELRLLGISKASLFPETENIMQEIKLSYGKTTGKR